MRRKARAGSSLVEVVVTTGVFALLLSGTFSILAGSTTAVNSTRAQVYADQDASLAMQWIVQDLREANRVAIYNGGVRAATGQEGGTMLVTRPRVVSIEGYYDRFQPDTANPVRYYLSDATGNPAVTGGTHLWKRAERTDERRLLRAGVRELRFLERSAGRIEVSLVTEAKASRASKRTELTQRVVYMRNKK